MFGNNLATGDQSQGVGEAGRANSGGGGQLGRRRPQVTGNSTTPLSSSAIRLPTDRPDCAGLSETTSPSRGQPGSHNSNRIEIGVLGGRQCIHQ